MYGWGMSQKMFVDGFKWVENLLKFNEDFIKSYDDNSNKNSKNLFNVHKDLPFLAEGQKNRKT